MRLSREKFAFKSVCDESKLRVPITVQLLPESSCTERDRVLRDSPNKVRAVWNRYRVLCRTSVHVGCKESDLNLSVVRVIGPIDIFAETIFKRYSFSLEFEFNVLKVYRQCAVFPGHISILEYIINREIARSRG